MEDQTSWKGHSFTLLVFAGIVVLSSIFFILGMLVGRAQGQKSAAAATSEAAVKIDAQSVLKDDDPPPPFEDSPKKNDPPESLSLSKPEFRPVPSNPSKRVDPATPSPLVLRDRANVINFQIAALRKASDAEKLLRELRRKGFSGFILSPAANDSNPLFRVQVGPFEDPSEAQDVKKRLEAAGYRPIIKK